MTRPGRWISLLPILALVPRLGLSVTAVEGPDAVRLLKAIPSASRVVTADRCPDSEERPLLFNFST